MRDRIILIFIALIILKVFFVHTSFAASVAVKWTNPTTNIDATTITDLAGIEIYYRTYMGTDTVINAGNTTCYVINNISTGWHYFRLKAYNTSAIRSDYSNEVEKDILSNNFGTCLGNVNVEKNSGSNISGGFGGGFQ